VTDSIKTDDPRLTSLLDHMPPALRAVVIAVDSLREKWASSSEEERRELWGEVDQKMVAVYLSAEPSLMEALADVVCERRRQDKRWGEQNYGDFEGISILTEEVGEAAQAANEANFISSPTRGDYSRLIEELIQVAAVAVNHIQIIRRRREGVTK
jgi:NTP pyrophosphatase (non-canonical NTP hydrolase)